MLSVPRITIYLIAGVGSSREKIDSRVRSSSPAETVSKDPSQARQRTGKEIQRAACCFHCSKKNTAQTKEDTACSAEAA